MPILSNGLGVILAGSGVVALGIWIRLKARHFRKASLVATGKVIHIVSPVTTRGHRHNTLIIQFTDRGGRELTVDFNGTGRSYRKGDTIQLRYQPDKPEKVELADEHPSEAAMQYVIMILGGCAILYGILLFFT